MTKRLQVLLDDAELRTIHASLAERSLTTAEWVATSAPRGAESRGRPDTAAKLAAIHAAYRHQAPAPDIDQMLAEIERGYLSDSSNP